MSNGLLASIDPNAVVAVEGLIVLSGPAVPSRNRDTQLPNVRARFRALALTAVLTASNRWPCLLRSCSEG